VEKKKTGRQGGKEKKERKKEGNPVEKGVPCTFSVYEVFAPLAFIKRLAQAVTRHRKRKKKEQLRKEKKERRASEERRRRITH